MNITSSSAEDKKAKVERWKSGVLSYANKGYWNPDYEPTEKDIICAFRLIPQEGVDPTEVAAGIAGESSTGTWTVVWTDRITAYEDYIGKAYKVVRVPDTDQYIAYIAYNMDLVEEGSIASLASTLIGNIFGIRALKSLRLEDMYLPPEYVKTFQGPAHGIITEREILNKYGRPLLTAIVKPKLGLSPRNYGRVVYESLRGGMDFSKDDENMTSQPYMRWRDRYLYVMEAVAKAQAETGEVKGHYFNVTAGTMEEMYERAEFAKQLGSVVIMVDLTVGYTAIQSLAKWCRRSGVILHMHRASHSTFTRQKTHGVSFRVLAKWMRLAGVDHLHAGTIFGKLDSDPSYTQGYYDILRNQKYQTDPMKGLYFDQDWASLSSVMPVASGGIWAGLVNKLIFYLGEDVIFQFGGGTLGHSEGIAEGATAIRVATEAMMQARNEGKDLLTEGDEVLKKAAKWCRPLNTAIQIWKDYELNYTHMDTPDVVATPDY